MSNAADTAHEEALLRELADLGMGMARRVHAVTLATDEADTLVALATAFHHISRGVRQSLALKARFAAGTVAPERPARSEAAAAPSPPRPETERADWNDYERPDWNERFATVAEPLDPTDDEPEVCIARIARDLTVVSRTPALAAIPALRPQAARLAGRAALLAGGALRLVDTS